MKKNTKGMLVNRSDLWISAKVIRTGFDKEPAAGGPDEATKQQMVRFFSQYRKIKNMNKSKGVGKVIKGWAVVDRRHNSISYGSSCPEKSREHDAEGFMAICEEKEGAETALREHEEFYKGCSVRQIQIRILPPKKKKV